MTKKVRIENADNGTKRVVVKAFRRTPNSTGLPDHEISRVDLASPTSMHDFYLTDDTYLVVEEAD